jgi:hypothetical protein
MSLPTLYNNSTTIYSFKNNQSSGYIHPYQSMTLQSTSSAFECINFYRLIQISSNAAGTIKIGPFPAMKLEPGDHVMISQGKVFKEKRK